jgi:hypothetical protein
MGTDEEVRTCRNRGRADHPALSAAEKGTVALREKIVATNAVKHVGLVSGVSFLVRTTAQLSGWPADSELTASLKKSIEKRKADCQIRGDAQYRQFESIWHRTRRFATIG